MTVIPAKTAEPIQMPFWMWIWMGSENHEGEVLRAKTDRPRTCPDTSGGRYTHSKSAAVSTGTVQMPTGVY